MMGGFMGTIAKGVLSSKTKGVLGGGFGDSAGGAVGDAAGSAVESGATGAIGENLSANAAADAAANNMSSSSFANDPATSQEGIKSRPDVPQNKGSFLETAQKIRGFAPGQGNQSSISQPYQPLQNDQGNLSQVPQFQGLMDYLEQNKNKGM